MTTGTIYTVSVAAVERDWRPERMFGSRQRTCANRLHRDADRGGELRERECRQRCDSRVSRREYAWRDRVSAPFSIVSGSPFTLGVGATQSVTVRFAPTAQAIATAHATFRADGDSISRLVTGVGLVVDQTPPTVTIISPTSNSVLGTGGASLTLRGVASDDVAVTQITWSNDRGGSGVATGTTDWVTDSITLVRGQNILTVTARDRQTTHRPLR